MIPTEQEKRIDACVRKYIDEILYSIPQDPDDEPPRVSLAQRKDADQLHEFMHKEIAEMLGKLVLFQCGVDPDKPGGLTEDEKLRLIEIAKRAKNAGF